MSSYHRIPTKNNDTARKLRIVGAAAALIVLVLTVGSMHPADDRRVLLSGEPKGGRTLCTVLQGSGYGWGFGCTIQDLEDGNVTTRALRSSVRSNKESTASSSRSLSEDIVSIPELEKILCADVKNEFGSEKLCEEVVSDGHDTRSLESDKTDIVERETNEMVTMTDLTAIMCKEQGEPRPAECDEVIGSGSLRSLRTEEENDIAEITDEEEAILCSNAADSGAGAPCDALKDEAGKTRMLRTPANANSKQHKPRQSSRKRQLMGPKKRTHAPTRAPTYKPSSAPTTAPTTAPTSTPTSTPTSAPSVAPTASPTVAPTVSPTSAPTANPDKHRCFISIAIECYQNGVKCGSEIASSSPVELVWTVHNLSTTGVTVQDVSFKVLVSLIENFMNKRVPDGLSNNYIPPYGSVEARKTYQYIQGDLFVWFDVTAQSWTSMTCNLDINAREYKVV